MMIDTSKEYVSSEGEMALDEPEGSVYTQEQDVYSEETTGGDMVQADSEQDEPDNEQQFYEEFDELVTPVDEPEPRQRSYFEKPKKQHDDGYVKRQNGTIAKLLVKTLDGAMAFSLSRFVAKNGKPEKYEASKEDLADMTQIVSEMMPSTHVPVSPMAQLGLVLVRVYGGKVDVALKDRKIAELEAKNAELEQKLKEQQYTVKQDDLQTKKINNHQRRMQQKLKTEAERRKLTTVRNEPIPESGAEEEEFSI